MLNFVSERWPHVALESFGCYWLRLVQQVRSANLYSISFLARNHSFAATLLSVICAICTVLNVNAFFGCYSQCHENKCRQTNSGLLCPFTCIIPANRLVCLPGNVAFPKPTVLHPGAGGGGVKEQCCLVVSFGQCNQYY